MAERLAAGVVLLIDYGFPRTEFYHPQRIGGSLMCHYRHRAHADPLILVGLQDITAHVDFTAIAEAAVEGGLSVYGYTSQALFLIGCGLEEVINHATTEDMQKQISLVQNVNKLTSPAEMGELYKVIALGVNMDLPLLGFQHQDRRGSL
jgi:SAM-dependent MidA family methyltransferase